MVILNNPLTREERLQIPRLLGHDSIENLCMVLGIASEMSERGGKRRYNKLTYFVQHSGLVEDTVESLTQDNELDLDAQTCNLINDFEIHEIHRRLETVLQKKISLKADSNINFRTFNFAYYTLLFNLTKNAFAADKSNPRVRLDFQKISNLPNGLTYVPEETTSFAGFVQLDVKNRAYFQTGRSFIEHLTTPPKRGKGFGLYYTGLISKILRAPIDIQSDPKTGTVISIYHPIYS